MPKKKKACPRCEKIMEALVSAREQLKWIGDIHGGHHSGHVGWEELVSAGAREYESIGEFLKDLEK